MLIWQKNLIKFSCCFLGLSCFINSARANPIFVDKELMLEIDVSDSIDAGEYQQIIEGYSNAFRDTSIQESIAKLNDGVAVGVQFFSSGQARMVSNAQEYLNSATYTPLAGNTPISNYFATDTQWFILDTPNDAEEFANFLDQFVGNRPQAGTDIYSFASGGCDTNNFITTGTGIGTGTNIAGAIQQGTCEINRTAQIYSRPNGTAITGNASIAKIIAAYEQAIDISSDGIQNTDITGDGTIVTNGACNDTVANQAACQLQLTTAQGQSANLTGIPNSGGFTFDSPITRINGLPVNNDVAYETDYFRDGYNQAALGGGSTDIGPVIGGVNPGPTSAISDNTFDTGPNVNGSFVVSADDYGAFEPAITLKLQNELEAVPFEFKPGFGLLLGLGIFGLRHWLSKKGNQELMVKSETETENKSEIDQNKTVLEEEAVLV